MSWQLLLFLSEGGEPNLTLNPSDEGLDRSIASYGEHTEPSGIVLLHGHRMSGCPAHRIDCIKCIAYFECPAAVGDTKKRAPCASTAYTESVRPVR